jgi:hypothetical protein
MSLLHATWLFPPEGAGGRLFLWADTWKVAGPVQPGHEAPDHPFALTTDEVADWLDDNGYWSEALRPARATLTLPSRTQASRGRSSAGAKGWSGLPLQAGEPIPRQLEWWPWQVEGWALDPGSAACPWRPATRTWPTTCAGGPTCSAGP